jgi:hypothetical protein
MKICAALVLAGSMAGCLAEEAGTLDGDGVDEEIATGESEESLVIPLPVGDLAVNASVSTAGERRWLWDMTVTPPTGLVLAEGESSFEQFDVHFWTTGLAESYTASGPITVTNRSRTRTTTVSTVVAYAGEVAATVSCPTLPVALAPGGSLACRYRVALPTSADRTLLTVAVPVGRPLAFDVDAINFGGAAIQDVDRVVEATASGHGQITVADADFEPDVHTDYHRQIGPFACGPFTSTGVASLRALQTPDSQRSGLVTITLPANATGTVTCP